MPTKKPMKMQNRAAEWQGIRKEEEFRSTSEQKKKRWKSHLYVKMTYPITHFFVQLYSVASLFCHTLFSSFFVSLHFFFCIATLPNLDTAFISFVTLSLSGFSLLDIAISLRFSSVEFFFLVEAILLRLIACPRREEMKRNKIADRMRGKEQFEFFFGIFSLSSLEWIVLGANKRRENIPKGILIIIFHSFESFARISFT